MSKLVRLLVAIAVLLLAFALRLVAIDQIPPGLSHDEAYNGITAIQVMHGQRLIFFEINKGIEPLIIYLEALAFYAFGIGPVQLRLVNVFCGLLTVALVYPLTARLFNRRVALLAMAGLAISFWAIFVSRLTLRAVTLPPLLILTLYFLWRGLEEGEGHSLEHKTQYAKLFYFALSGLAAGITMYTYLSSRFLPLLVLAIFGFQFIRRQLRAYHWLGLVIHLAIWAAILMPLAGYFWQNAASFTERSSQVTTIPYLLNGEFGPTVRNTLRTLGMFTLLGDETDRYNLDGRPVFDWINGLIFYLGFGLLVLRLRRPPPQAGPAALLLLWLFFMLLPDFITDDSPHFLRTIGALPPVYIMWALGVDWGTNFVSRRVKRLRDQHTSPAVTSYPLGLITYGLPVLLLLATTFHTAYDYFIRWASAAEGRAIYGADIAAIARYLKTNSDGELAALSAEYYRDLDPFRLALHFGGNPPFVIWFDGRQSLAFPPPQTGLSPQYIFAASAPPADIWLPVLSSLSNETNQDYTVYQLPPETWRDRLKASLFSGMNTLGITINDDLVLLGYEVMGEIISGGKFQVLLAWEALRPLPPGTDYTFLVRMWDSQGHLWAEDDGNGYPPSMWQPGVQGLQLLTLRLPGDLPPRTYHLTVEVVDRRTGQPLPAAAGETQIPLAAVPGKLAGRPRPMEPDRLPNPFTKLEQVDKSGPVLRGYQLKRRNFQTGDNISITLHWQVLRQPSKNYQLAFSLHDNHAISYRWSPVEPIGGEWPTSQWPANYWVQDKLDLPVSSDIPSGEHTVRIQWQTTDNSSFREQTSFELGTITIQDK